MNDYTLRLNKEQISKSNH